VQDINDKITGGSLTAIEWNEVPSELQNVIESMGLTLSSGDLNQLGKAIADYAAAGAFYSETGIADAYVATVIGAKQGLHTLLAVVDGAIVRFCPGNANTGVSTLNVNSLGVKALTREDGNPLVAGDLVTTRDAACRWDQANDHWHLFDFALAAAPVNGTHLIDAGVIATTSGTVFNWTGLPSYVKRITVNFDQVGVDGTDDLLIQIGDSGGIETSGYESHSHDGSANATSTAGFIVRQSGASRQARVHMVMTRVAPNDWLASHVGSRDVSTSVTGAGIKTLSAGPLTQVRLTRDGSDLFDEGQCTVFYE
jgi:hypothetical protein